MRMLFFFLLTLAAGLIQVAFLNQARLFGAGPDLFLALTVIAAVNLNAGQAAACGLFNGMLKDMFDPAPFGINAAVFALAALAVARLNRTLRLDNAFSCSLFAGAAVIAAGCASWFLLLFFQPGVPGPAFLRVIFLEALLTAVTVPVLIRAVNFAAHSPR